MFLFTIFPKMVFSVKLFNYTKNIIKITLYRFNASNRRNGVTSLSIAYVKFTERAELCIRGCASICFQALVE